MTRSETIKILRLLRSVWPDQPIHEDTIQVWTWVFEDVTYANAEDAVKRHIQASRWFPKPADILGIIRGES